MAGFNDKVAKESPKAGLTVTLVEQIKKLVENLAKLVDEVMVRKEVNLGVAQHLHSAKVIKNPRRRIIK